MKINSQTRIGTLIKQNPESLEAIISLSPKFSKLRNPVLRKVIASRTSIAMACTIGGCTIDNFFEKLSPLGFEIDLIKKTESPKFMPVESTFNPESISPENIVETDVRPIIESGKDPLTLILSKIKELRQNQVLKIINSFEPTPLIHLLNKQGFGAKVDRIDEDVVHTFFYKISDTVTRKETAVSVTSANEWEQTLKLFADKLITIDVRNLPMPQPMHAILESLSTLPEGNALYVFHKRIPVFLLPELEQQQFNYRIKEINDGEVHLLIFKK